MLFSFSTVYWCTPLSVSLSFIFFLIHKNGGDKSNLVVKDVLRYVREISTLLYFNFFPQLCSEGHYLWIVSLWFMERGGGCSVCATHSSNTQRRHINLSRYGICGTVKMGKQVKLEERWFTNLLVAFRHKTAPEDTHSLWTKLESTTQMWQMWWLLQPVNNQAHQPEKSSFT